MWQTYNGAAWVNATTLPPSPFTKTIYSAHYLDLNSPLKLVGNAALITTGQLQVRSGSTVEIGETASLSFKELRVAPGGVVVNNGQMNGNNNSSSITIEANGTLTNNALISTINSSNFSLNLLSDSKVEFGKEGVVRGKGSLTVSHHANIYIANPNGMDGCIDLTGSKTYDRANFVFNGDSPQITGTSMPANVLNVVVNNPAGLTLSRNVNVVDVFKVDSGASLILELSIIDKAWYGAGTFILSSGAQISTANPQGISSTGNTGSILVTVREYNSAANYTFNGTTQQQTGNFVTQPDNNPTDGMVPIDNLHISNPNGVTITNPLAVADNVTVLEGFAQGSVVIVGQESKIDGFISYNYYHSFAPNEVLISNYIPYTDTNNVRPQTVKRQWEIKGDFIGTKQLTFYWEPAEDSGLDWNLESPVVRQGSQILVSDAWDTNSSPRWVTTTITSLGNGEMFYITGSSENTLPVELSSFNVSPSHNGGVKLLWVTQSESNVIGYYIWRASTTDLVDAQIASPLVAATNTSTGQTYLFTDSAATPGVEYWYWLQSVDYDGGTSYFGPVYVKLETSAEIPSVPGVTNLLNPYPNPFNPSVNIAYSMEKTGYSELKIYNQKGQVVRKLFAGNSKAGKTTLIWNGDDEHGKACGSGNYLIIMETAGKRFVQKVALVK